MQKLDPKNSNKNVPFIEVFVSTLTKVGNFLIIVLGVLYYGIRRAVFIISGKKDKQTLYQFITELDKHLNAASKSRKPAQSGKAYPNNRPAPGRARNSINRIPANTKKVLIVRTSAKKHSKYLMKIIIALCAATVVVSSVFVFKGLAGMKKETSLKEAEAAQATGSVYKGKITKDFTVGLEVLPGAIDGGDREYNTGKITKTPSPESTSALNTGGDAENTEPVEPGEFQTPQVDPEILLHKGDTNDLVPLIQERLMDLHYMDADEPTDNYGEMTSYAIQLFQRNHELMVDGVAGYASLTLLFSEEVKPYMVREGDYGFDIYMINNRLIELGYLNESDSGKNFTETTDYAVRVFQGRNKLSQDGIVGYNTTQVLFNGDAKPAKSYKPPSDGGSDGGDGGSDGGSYNPNNANSLVSYAKAQMNKGYTYIWGGKGPPGMDCSGFVYYCLKQTGNTSIGYMTSGAWAKSSYKSITSIHDAKPGDILCFEGHVAICIGGGKMIDSSSSSNAIRIANYESSSYWNRKWICAKRVFP